MKGGVSARGSRASGFAAVVAAVAEATPLEAAEGRAHQRCRPVRRAGAAGHQVLPSQAAARAGWGVVGGPVGARPNAGRCLPEWGCWSGRMRSNRGWGDEGLGGGETRAILWDFEGRVRQGPPKWLLLRVYERGTGGRGVAAAKVAPLR